MKKFFEKYDLVKLAGILVLISIVLTWLIPYGYYGSEFTTQEIQRIGFTNLAQMSILEVYYFFTMITFLFVLGGFYQVLSKTKGYQSLVKGLSKKLEGHEVLFVVIVSFIFAVLSSVISGSANASSIHFVLFAFVPFIISVLNRLKVDKLAAFSATFGAILVGVIGSTYSSDVALKITSAFVDSYIWVKVILLCVPYILLTLFTVLRMVKSKKKSLDYDMFEVETIKPVTKRNSKIVYVICSIIFAIVLILAYFPWASFEVTAFTNATKWVNELEIGGVPLVSYIFGTFTEFGQWDLFTIQYVMFFATLLIILIGKMSFTDAIDSYIEGFKKMLPTVMVFMVIYLLLFISVSYAVIPTIVNWIMTLASGFNVVLAFLSATISSIFGIEMQYVTNMTGAYMAGSYAENVDILAIIYQSAYGLVSFFAPSSVILMLGLSYLDIPYKDWMKYIWKFLLALFAVIVIIIAVMMLFVL